MNDLRSTLHRQLGELESEKELIEEAIQEINRRFSILDDVESWGLAPQSEEFSPVPETFESSVFEAVEEPGVVNAEREEEFEFAVAAEFGVGGAMGADGMALETEETFNPEEMFNHSSWQG